MESKGTKGFKSTPVQAELNLKCYILTFTAPFQGEEISYLGMSHKQILNCTEISIQSKYLVTAPEKIRSIILLEIAVKRGLK